MCLWFLSVRLKKCITVSRKSDSLDVYLSKLTMWYTVSVCGRFMWLVDRIHTTASEIGSSGNCKGIMWLVGRGMQWHRARQSNQWDSDMWACFTCTHKTCKWECSKEKQKKQLTFLFSREDFFFFKLTENMLLRWVVMVIASNYLKGYWSFFLVVNKCYKKTKTKNECIY